LNKLAGVSVQDSALLATGKADRHPELAVGFA